MTTPARSAGWGRFDAPDWIMLGIKRSEGGVLLLASREISSAEVEAFYTEPETIFDSYFTMRRPTGIERIEIRGTVRTFVMAYGDTYGDAFRNLMQFWNPDGDPEPRRVTYRDTQPLAIPMWDEQR